MREELQNKLCQDYPKIFGQNFYFECGDGWYEIIDKACSVMQARIDANKNYVEYCIKKEKTLDIQEMPQVEALQVKEKFGGLRFYTNETSQFCRGVIEVLESISNITCEVCGEKGKKRNVAWIRTLCDLHYEADTKRKP